ncbi:hypothetical protein HV265_00505 [Citrobacter sp. RHBSTW-00678]|uniref:Uncharacterized protein n=1 Tax=Citrobacter braakii TaxID=57706 RepID=A0A8I0G033_CITBR|nr:hypothetical protein [Citrobacter braakii]MBA7756237.1 hypothetical protein [Citrobacter sp. RHBSTW-00325]MBA8056086.1 hypothetical protein [Citrobacter sp. RHBSTW-00104]MBP5854317.1 hypothetical protein [Citrobacter sp. AN-PRR1]QLR12563.1 hypothetical protein HV352_00515 [Citrobacter sp. RHBSTW-01044]QLR60682.1 hypothetical protein HV341_00505 [Citrobacter sp. RHBSTW-00976]QLS32640.1 hypothetical protein HV320_00515 [Citrobacter sp. RHBSTW-00903]QLS63181.1 hypothetical protein HV311_0064
MVIKSIKLILNVLSFFISIYVYYMYKNKNYVI